jgi:SAM-dependent methyltransferase
MDLDELVRDRLPANAPYDGLLAEAYDVWLPPDGHYSDREIYRRIIAEDGGPALELGCGNGRLLIGYSQAGLDVEGVDASASMLAICAEHARDAGITLPLHHADWLTLALGKQYATLYVPAGSFALIHDVEDARRALVAWRNHLRPGGRLVLSAGEPPPVTGYYEWRVRRSGTRESDGMTFMVHEAIAADTDAQLHHDLNRHEVWDRNGELVTTFMRRHRLRWWKQEQLAELLTECGYIDVNARGADDGYLAFGRTPE